MPYQLAPFVTDSMIREETRRKNRSRVQVTQRIFKRPVTMRFFMRLKNDDKITEFCVIPWNGFELDPHMFVETIAPDGTKQHWPRYEEGKMFVFRPPDGYDGGPIGWCYNRKCWAEGLTEEQTKRYFGLGSAKGHWSPIPCMSLKDVGLLAGRHDALPDVRGAQNRPQVVGD